ncbi:E3 ubiquitin-protein ligase RNF103 [Parasteatoda tepidariorum]|uniref:E3 ubiquitin-protein ligase RNF103 n=1 Tax=Parasteatoda tepidariorum TaxID=114398 RepID=UPI001C71C9BC|nr:E3 ubiquitin-protein ligase RNF103 [Parasteatoda tepidariorum]
MWLKLLLLTLYFVFLFVLCRMLETFSWYNDTGSLVTSFVVLDPISLSVKKLKELLDNRGVSYSGVFEKPELVELVKSSGQVTKEELIDALFPSKAAPETTHFTCGSHFYEEVEDTKDSAWLVQVDVDGAESTLLSEKSWEEIRQTAGNFGVRSGVFKCSLDRRLCHRKGWTTSRLILALPRGHKAKEDVILHNHLLPSTPSSILHWVRKHLASRVHEIQTNEELDKWLTYPDGKNSEIRILFFSLLKSCPMFLSAMAIKFNGRVKIGTVDVTTVKSYKRFVKSEDIPAYVVITPEKTSSYGARRGECYNSKSLELYLRTFVPEMNDVFLWSLLLVNVLAAFELFYMNCSFWKHFILYAVCVVKYNCALFLLWLLILALYRFPVTMTLTEISLKCLRIVSGSSVGAILRNDYKCFYSNPFLLFTFAFFASVSGYFLKKFKWLQLVEEDTIFSSFQSLAASRRTVSFQEIDLEIDMDLFVERLSVPNLYIQPVILMDYIKYLPMWKYEGWCDADDELERRRDVLFSSDDESVKISNKPPVPEIKTYTSDGINSIDVSISDNVSSQTQCDVNAGVVLQSRPTIHSELESSRSILQKPRAPDGMLELRECSICLENYRYSECLCGLPCGHNFHMNCIMVWLTRDNHCCPICRRPSYKPRNAMYHQHSQ